VVRLTGDNIFPDGGFIDALLKDFADRSLSYLCCGGEGSGLPYGVSAEVTRVGCLRDAHKQAETAFDFEHVTPGVIARFGRTFFEGYGALGMSSYRCTVDTLDDYLRVCRLFSPAEKADHVPLLGLLERLRQTSPEVVTSAPAHRMVLGTAQFGLAYGIANTRGRPVQEEVNGLIHTAIANGVHYIDTARAYGDSEQVLGKALAGGWDSRATIITKLSPLDDCPAGASASIVKAFVERSIFQSCHRLRQSCLDVAMLHRAEHLTAWNGLVWETLSDLKQRKTIDRLGVSVQSPGEALSALDFETVEFIQLPFNILDYRWDAVIEKVSQVRQYRPLVIHARSALLQGLLTSKQLDLWQRAFCSNAIEVIDWLQTKAEEFAHGDVVELALRLVLSQSWIDGVVVGVETREQLVYSLKKSSLESWTENRLAHVLADRPRVPLETLNPAKWKSSNEC
jgi:spore coat polysaccharide biosynthesis protein SpsF